MLFSFLTDRNRTRSLPLPLAHAAQGCDGRIRLESTGESLPVVILEVSATGAQVRAIRRLKPGEQVIGEYDVQGVPFAFRGVVTRSEANHVGSYEIDLRYVTAPLG